MKICELKQSDIVVGLRIRSLINPLKLATVVEIDYVDDNYAWIIWDGNDYSMGGFYGIDCECEVVYDEPNAKYGPPPPLGPSKFPSHVIEFLNSKKMQR